MSKVSTSALIRVRSSAKSIVWSFRRVAVCGPAQDTPTPHGPTCAPALLPLPSPRGQEPPPVGSWPRTVPPPSTQRAVRRRPRASAWRPVSAGHHGVTLLTSLLDAAERLAHRT